MRCPPSINEEKAATAYPDKRTPGHPTTRTPTRCLAARLVTEPNDWNKKDAGGTPEDSFVKVCMGCTFRCGKESIKENSVSVQAQCNATQAWKHNLTKRGISTKRR